MPLPRALRLSDGERDKTSPEELVSRFKDLVARFDAELRKAGLTDEQREQLVKEILEEGGTGEEPLSE